MRTKPAFLAVALVALLAERSANAATDGVSHYRLKRHVYKLELSGAPLARILCTVSDKEGSSDTVTWDPEERRAPLRYALLPKSFGAQDATHCKALASDCEGTFKEPDKLRSSCDTLARTCRTETTAVYEDAVVALYESCKEDSKAQLVSCEDNAATERKSCTLSAETALASCEKNTSTKLAACELRANTNRAQCEVLTSRLPKTPEPQVTCHGEPLVLKSEAGNTVISYASQAGQGFALEDCPEKKEDRKGCTPPLQLRGTIISDASPTVVPAAPTTGTTNPSLALPEGVKIRVSAVEPLERNAVLKYSTGLDNSTRLRSLDPTTRVINDALTTLATIALDRAKAAGKAYMRSTLRLHLCDNLTVANITERLEGSNLSVAIGKLGWNHDQPLLKNTCRLLDSLSVDELVASPDLVWKGFGMDVAELGTEVIIGRLAAGSSGHPEYHLRRVLSGARSLLISALSDGSTTTERDAQLLILELGSLGMMPHDFAPPARSWSNGLEIGIAVLQECLRSGPCGADLLRQGLERELAVAGAAAILETWPELPSLIGRAADVLQPSPGTPARVTAANALSLALDVTDKLLEFRNPTCLSDSVAVRAIRAKWTGQTWTCEPPHGTSKAVKWSYFEPGSTLLEERLNAVPLCAEEAYSNELKDAQVPALKGASPSGLKCESGTNYQLLKALAADLPMLRGTKSLKAWNASADDLVEYARVKSTRDVMASLRGLVGALQGGDVATAIAGLAKMLTNCVREHCGDDGCEGFTARKLEGSFRMLAAVATYGASYRKRGDSEPAAEVEKARADERRRAMETLIDAATDRTDRYGDWVLSLGSDVAVGAEWHWRAGDPRKFNHNPLSLGTGVAVQRLSRSWVPGHFMFSVLDLAQYAAVTEEEAPTETMPMQVDGAAPQPAEEPSLRTPNAELLTALRLGLEAGWVLGMPSSPSVLTVYGAWLPAVKFGDETKSAWTAGLKLGIYIPFFDFN